MKKIDIVIDNPTGLHARPAKYFVKIAKTFTSDISVFRENKKANAKSLVSMLTLGIKCGYAIRIEVEGIDEDQAFDSLKKAIESGLGEEKNSSPVPEKTDHYEPLEEKDPDRPHDRGENKIKAIAAAPGIAIGPVWQLKRSEIKIQETFKGSSVEQTRLQEAIEKARAQLELLCQQMKKHASDEADIFNVHLELLEDPELLEQVLAKLEAGETAAQAWQSTVNAHAQALHDLDDPLLAAREADLHDISYRVLRLLIDSDEPEFQTPEHPVIIIAKDLSPSETASLDRTKILGFCTAAGGPTAHSAIIARAMGIPAIVSAGDQVLDIPIQTQVILNGDRGVLTIEPSKECISHAKTAARQSCRRNREEKKSAAEPAVTTDGYKIEVVGNIGGIDEANKVIESGAEGVGLLRTEFLFLDQQKAPTQEEQFKVYKKIVQAMQGRPIIIRTLDIGGDKPLPYVNVPPEANPFLGERGIRLCLNRPELLKQQLRAIYKAAAFGKVRIMFPMVADISEWHQIRTITNEIIAQLKCDPVELGVMIEVPSAALTAHSLAEHIDFFSIGTNDLTQYTLAIDRMHPSMAARLDGLHPAVLQLIENTVSAAKKYGKWVGVCGELAADPKAVPILLGLGVKELSVSLPAAPAVKAQIRSISFAETRTTAQKALCCALPEEVRKLTEPLK